jgi:prolyl-tRNA synthetase
MKDAYSFHIDQASLAQGYRLMFDAYSRIFTRIGLNFRAVQADGGSIGGSTTQEFHVLADSGEDAIAFSDADDYAANLEMAATIAPTAPRAPAAEALTKIPTPNARTIAELGAQLGVDPSRCIKTLLVDGSDGGVVALVIRGDHDLNAVKAQRLPGVANPLRMASGDRVRRATGTEPGFIGPIGFAGIMHVDYAAAHLADFICGANEKDMHFRGVNWGRDLPEPQPVDIRNATRARAAAEPWRSREASRWDTFSSWGSCTAPP